MDLKQFGVVIAATIAITSVVASCATVPADKQAYRIPDRFNEWADPTAQVVPNSLIRLAVDNLKDVRPQWQNAHFGVGTVGYEAQCVVLFGPYEKGNRLSAQVFSRYGDAIEAKTPTALARRELTQWVVARRIECDS